MAESNGCKGQMFTLFPELPKEIRLLIWNAALPGPRVVHLQQRKLKSTIREWEQKTGRSWPVFPGEMRAVNEAARDTGTSGIEESFEADRDRRFQRRVMRHRINEALGADGPPSTRYRGAHMLGLYSDSPTPEMTLVNREAYDVVSKSYPRVFSGPASFAQTWFNGALDTLYIRNDTYWVYPLGGPILDINDGFPVLDVENMRKVKKLAIWWDLGWTNNAPMRQRPLTEDWTAPVLKLFGGVEELVLVLHHYGNEGEEENQTVHLIDPIWVDEALEKYNRIIADPKSGDTLEVRAMDIGVSGEELDLELLEEYRQNFGEGKPSWTMPRFVEKVAVTEGVRRKLDDAKRRAEMALKERGVAGI